MRLYVLAMESEAKDIIKDFTLIQEKPYMLYQNKETLVAITKVGKVNASFVLSSVLTKYVITKIINLGFAGANGNYHVGDVLMVSEARYHDFDATMFGYELGQVPGLPVSYTSDKELIENLSYKTAKLYTGDCFMTVKTNDNFLVDMEGTALFQVAYLTKIPMISIKVVSDVIGKEKHLEEYNEFEKNGSKLIKQIYDQLETKL